MTQAEPQNPIVYWEISQTKGSDTCDFPEYKGLKKNASIVKIGHIVWDWEK